MPQDSRNHKTGEYKDAVRCVWPRCFQVGLPDSQDGGVLKNSVRCVWPTVEEKGNGGRRCPDVRTLALVSPQKEAGRHEKTQDDDETNHKQMDPDAIQAAHKR